MARLKAMLQSAFEDRSPRFLLGTIALGVVVSLLAGFAIGYKVDDTNGGSGSRRATTASGNKNNGKKPPRVKGAPLLVGTVDSLSRRKLVVLNAKQKKRPMGLGAKTRIYVTANATAADIKVGTRVLFQPSPTAATTAIDVVVLPSKAAIGSEVTAVVPGTSMSLKSLKGTDVVKTNGAVVRKTATGKRSNLDKGGKVLVQYFVIRGKRNSATAIVVLPQDAKFQ